MALSGDVACGRSSDPSLSPRADSDDARELIANIWDWDPGWTVVWYADGDRRGAMAQRIGWDPLSSQLQGGLALPPNRPWIDPYRTRHLFYAPAFADVREYRVEATDRFGRVYSASVQTANTAA